MFLIKISCILNTSFLGDELPIYIFALHRSSFCSLKIQRTVHFVSSPFIKLMLRFFCALFKAIFRITSLGCCAISLLWYRPIKIKMGCENSAVYLYPVSPLCAYITEPDINRGKLQQAAADAQRKTNKQRENNSLNDKVSSGSAFKAAFTGRHHSGGR